MSSTHIETMSSLAWTSDKRLIKSLSGIFTPPNGLVYSRHTVNVSARAPDQVPPRGQQRGKTEQYPSYAACGLQGPLPPGPGSLEDDWLLGELLKWWLELLTGHRGSYGALTSGPGLFHLANTLILQSQRRGRNTPPRVKQNGLWTNRTRTGDARDIGWLMGGKCITGKRCGRNKPSPSEDLKRSNDSGEIWKDHNRTQQNTDLGKHYYYLLNENVMQVTFWSCI